MLQIDKTKTPKKSLIGRVTAFVLLLFAGICLWLLYPLILLVYSIKEYTVIGHYWMRQAYYIDYLFARAFNMKYPTISESIGRFNAATGGNWITRFTCKVLGWIDADHCEDLVK